MKKKYLIAGLIGLVTVTGALAYLQYKKIMDYVISVKSAAIRELSATSIIIDLYLNYQNKSSLGFEIVSQTYKIYLNNMYVTKATNFNAVRIAPNSTSDLPLRVKLNPTEALKNVGGFVGILKLTGDINNIMLKVESKLKVKIFGIPFNIPYTYENSIANLKAGKY